MVQPDLPTRERILRAADAIANESGAGTVSLDAVAARAGISKGGLLYHFPSKGKLLQALVEDYVGRIEAQLNANIEPSRPNGVILALIDHFVSDWCLQPPAGGLLAALADDPSILAPVAAFKERILARIRSNATDPALAELIYFALQGCRNGRLLGMHVPPQAELVEMIGQFRARLEAA